MLAGHSLRRFATSSRQGIFANLMVLIIKI